MGRTLVKILNIGYLAAAAVSIWSLTNHPIFQTSVDVDMTPTKLGELLEPLFKESIKSSPRTRDSSSEKKEITDYITAESIADAFVDPDHPEKSGFHLSIPLKIDSKYAFQLKNPNVIKETVVDNVYTIVGNSCDTLSAPLTRFVFHITEQFALTALEQAIQAQIDTAIADGSKVDPVVVKEIYENVYTALKDNEDSIPISDLTDIIINGKDGGASALSILNEYVRYKYQDVTITEEEWASNKTEYFVYLGSGRYENTETYDSSAQYKTYIYESCDPALKKEDFDANPTKYFVFDSESNKYINTTEFDEKAEYFARKEDPYTEEDLNRIDIEGKMEEALNEVPGLVETKFVEVPKDKIDVNIFNKSLKSNKYFITNGAGVFDYATFEDSAKTLYVKGVDEEGVETYIKVTEAITDFNDTLVSSSFFIKVEEDYVAAKYPFSDSTTYYASQASINDIDTALLALLNQYLLKKEGGSDGKAITRAEPLLSAKSQDEIKAALQEFIMTKFIPMDKIEEFSNRYGKMAPYILLIIVLLVAFPWALFALVTLIRTFRKYKCWTKPWIVIVLAFPQLFFGFILTYGAKYALDIAGDKVELIRKLLDSGMTVNISTLCLVPSFVYLAVFAYTFIYIICAHGVKRQYKFRKRAEAFARYRARAGRYNNYY